jgi:hypothetical protein
MEEWRTCCGSRNKRLEVGEGEGNHMPESQSAWCCDDAVLTSVIGELRLRFDEEQARLYRLPEATS